MDHPIIINHLGCAIKYVRTKVRPSLPYQGVARRAFGAPIAYDTNIDVNAASSPPESVYAHDCIVINNKGRTGKRHNWITLPDFEIVSSPSIRIDEVKRRRFNIIDRTTQKTNQELMAAEDEAIWKALYNIAKADK